ncbi:MAG: hypothetical protein QF412_12560 [Planctomycetota bacterium]|nr:hypothetical protein [Planctomycetota bacterium]
MDRPSFAEASMHDNELTPFLKNVLDAVHEHTSGVTVNAAGEPELRYLDRLSSLLDEPPEIIRQALLGLRAEHCLMEFSVEVAGIEPFVWWTVHPQCLN